VYPLDDRGTARLLVPKPSPVDPHRTHFTYYPGAVRLSETAAPNTKNRSHRIDVAVTEPGDGVLLAFGGTSAGFVLYVKDGKPTYHYNWFNRTRTSITSDTRLPDSPSTVSLEFRYDGGGAGKGGDAILFINEQEVGHGRIEQTVAARFGLDTMDVGKDTGAPVSEDYRSPFPFTGTIDHVDIHLGPPGLDPSEESSLHAKFTAGKEY